MFLSMNWIQDFVDLSGLDKIELIRKFSLSTAYANKSVYLLWSQVWAVIIFHENLSLQNIIGILIVLIGVWMVQRYE